MIPSLGESSLPTGKNIVLFLYLRPLLSGIRYRNSILKLDAGITPPPGLYLVDFTSATGQAQVRLFE